MTKHLEELATLLETHDFGQGKFHLATWMAPYAAVVRSLLERELFDPALPALQERAGKSEGDAFSPYGKSVYGYDLVDPNVCKTVGCAVGWGAALIPSWKEEGFRLECHPNKGSEPFIALETGHRRWSGLQALTEFFRIDSLTAERLFYPNYYRIEERSDPKAVAQRIRGYLTDLHFLDTMPL